MTDVAIPWKRIYATYPEFDNMAASRGWTREEIGAMVKHSRDSMEQAVVLVLASSGMRAGGLDLEWRDVTPVYRAGDKRESLEELTVCEFSLCQLSGLECLELCYPCG